MRQRLRSHLTYANVISTLALFLVLGGGTALAAYVVSSNSQIGPDTVSGHKPPTGKHANIIGGSVNATDLANQAVTAGKIGAPEAWHNVAAGSTTGDACSGGATAVFCVGRVPFNGQPWHNYGGGFAAAGFYKDQLGIVHLKGVVATPRLYGNSDPQISLIFRLPAAYAPANARIFPSVGRNFDGQEVSQSRVDVWPGGEVVFEEDCQSDKVDCSANGDYVTLDAISYRPEG
jgi:hypothetical protein